MEDKRFYWLKLKRDFFKRHDIQIVENMPNGKDYILFYLKMLVESVDHEGKLRFSDTIPYNEQMLATITNTNIDLVRSAMEIFTNLEMIEIIDDGTIYMTETMKMLGSAVDNDNANRQRRFRERKNAEKAIVLEKSVTKNNAGVTELVTNDNESKSKSKSIELDSKENISREKSRFVPPSLQEVTDYINERNSDVDPIAFWNFYESKGWMVGKNKMVSWKRAVVTWERNSNGKPINSSTNYKKQGNEFLALLDDMEDGNE